MSIERHKKGEINVEKINLPEKGEASPAEKLWEVAELRAEERLDIQEQLRSEGEIILGYEDLHGQGAYVRSFASIVGLLRIAFPEIAEENSAAITTVRDRLFNKRFLRVSSEWPVRDNTRDAMGLLRKEDLGLIPSRDFRNRAYENVWQALWEPTTLKNPSLFYPVLVDPEAAKEIQERLDCAFVLEAPLKDVRKVEARSDIIAALRIFFPRVVELYAEVEELGERLQEKIVEYRRDLQRHRSSGDLAECEYDLNMVLYNVVKARILAAQDIVWKPGGGVELIPPQPTAKPDSEPPPIVRSF